MSIFSQIGIIMLIAGIWMIIVRSNKELAKACEEDSDSVPKTGFHQADTLSLETDFHRTEYPSSEAGLHQAEHPASKTGPLPGSAEPEAEEQEIPPPIILIRYDENRRIEESRRVETLPYVIGRDPDCDMVLSDLGVARRHCTIDYKDGKYLLTDNGTHNRLFVGDRQVDQAELTDGIGLFIGNTEFSIKYTA